MRRGVEKFFSGALFNGVLCKAGKRLKDEKNRVKQLLSEFEKLFFNAGANDSVNCYFFNLTLMLGCELNSLKFATMYVLHLV